jgi:hypothetical protein
VFVLTFSSALPAVSADFCNAVAFTAAGFAELANLSAPAAAALAER